MSLFPYRYAAAQESARTGMPMMRALVLIDQDDDDAREAETEYYFGPDPCCARAERGYRARRLSSGRQLDRLLDGARLTGRRTLAAAAPIDRIPLYVREGAILQRFPTT